MEKPVACAVCQERTHHSDACPELTKELRPGFYKPAGGMPQGGGDDDDEHLNNTTLSPLFAVLVKHNTCRDSHIQRPQNSILANRNHGRIQRI